MGTSGIEKDQTSQVEEERTLEERRDKGSTKQVMFPGLDDD